MIGAPEDIKVDLLKLTKSQDTQSTVNYKWNIELLFNNGKYVYGEVECNCQSSSEVANKFFNGNINTYNAMRGVYEEDKAQIFFRLGDVSCFKIQEERFCMKV